VHVINIETSTVYFPPSGRTLHGRALVSYSAGPRFGTSGWLSWLRFSQCFPQPQQICTGMVPSI